MNNDKSIFTKQFCGSHSFGPQEHLDHLDSMPAQLLKNTNMTLAKPQESFNDKIRNLTAGSAPRPQQHSLGASEQKQILTNLTSLFTSAGKTRPHNFQLVDDKLKLQ
jgi:hypothetical protein